MFGIDESIASRKLGKIADISMNIIEFEDWENTAEALNLEGRGDDSQAPTSFDPDALEGVEVIDEPIQAS